MTKKTLGMIKIKQINPRWWPIIIVCILLIVISVVVLEKYII
jgi:hypothetical protein